MTFAWMSSADWIATMGASVDYPAMSAIRRASQDVALYLRSAMYTADTDGLPTEPDLRAMVVSAVAEQIVAQQYADARRAASAANPLGVPLESATVNSATWKAATTAVVDDGYAIPTAGHRLCANALGALMDFPRQIQVYG